jgi:hypothetical protein
VIDNTISISKISVFVGRLFFFNLLLLLLPILFNDTRALIVALRRRVPHPLNCRLTSVTSTPQWIRQPTPRGCVFVFFVSMYSDVLGFLTSPHAIQTRSGCHLTSFRLLRRSTSVPHPIPRAHFLHLPTSPRLSLCTSTMTVYLTTT